MTAKAVLVKSAVAATSIAAASAAVRHVDPKFAVRWGIRHALPGAAMKIASGRGDYYGRLMYDRALHADPYPFFDEIRAAGPVVPGAFAMMTTRHDVVSYLVKAPGWLNGFPDEVLPRPLRAAMAWAQDPAALSAAERPSMIVNNGEQHTRHRRLVGKAFTARAVEALTGRVMDLAAELLDGMERKQRAGGVPDVMNDFAAQLPVLVIAEIMGVPAEMKDTFLDWARAMTPIGEIGLSYPAYRGAENAVRELNLWLMGHFEYLRRNPSDALLSRIISAAEDEITEGGVGLSDWELCSIANLTLFAGFETTVHMISNGVVQLLGHPDQLAGLREDPSGWRNAIEEILRFEPPFQNNARYFPEDTEVFGVPVPAGKLIAIMFGGANRDPAVFANPNTFDVRRANARDHLTFSHGVHFCPGSALARLEGEIALRLLFERFPGLGVAGTPVRRPTRNLRGWDSIPVALNVGGSVASAAEGSASAVAIVS